MAEKCISSFGTTVDTHKNTLNCHSTLIVEHPTTTLIRSNNIKIMDHTSQVSLDATDDNCTTFNRNLLDNCNVIIGVDNKNDKKINIIKKITNNKNDILNNDIDDVGCGSSGSSDEISCSNDKNIINNKNNDPNITRNELKNLNLNSTNHHHQHDTNIIYLETPVIDENNVCLIGSNHDFEKVQVKPKRLSDEFLSSDDDIGEEDDDKIDIDDISGSSSSTAIKLSTIEQQQELTTKIIPATSTTPAPTSIEDDININNNVLRHSLNNNNNKEDDDGDDDDNSNANFMPVVVSTSSSRDFLEDELNSSSCSNLGECLKDDESQLLILNDDDDETREPSTSSLSAIDELCKRNKYRLISNNIDRICGSGDVGSGGGGGGITSSESTVSYYENDVQSMDAIERRDFEQEQRLTGGILLRARSLVNSDNKLNLELIKTYHNNNSNDSGERAVASDSKFITTQREQQLTTTPTSSRNCTIRLTKSTAKINLSATLDYLKDSRLEKKEQKLKLIHLQPSTSKNQNKSSSSQLLSSSTNITSSIAPITTTTATTSTSSTIKTTIPILGTRNLLCGKNNNNNKKFNILFTNSNSNDSLSSDKSYSTSSNHSLPNVSSKSASNSTIINNNNNNNNCTSTSTSSNCNKSIIDKTDEIKMKMNINNNSNNNNNSTTTTVNNNNNNNNSIQNYDLVNANLYSADRIVSSVSKEYSVDDDEDDDDDDDDDDEEDDDDDDDEDDDVVNGNFCCSEQQQKQQKERINNNNTKNIIEIEKFNDNITISNKNLSKSIINNSKSVRFNKKILDIKDSCNYNNNNNVFNKSSSSSIISTKNNNSISTLPATSSSSSSSIGNSSVLPQQSLDINNEEQIIENNNFNENQLNQDNNLINETQSQQQQHHHDTDFDDETWADCEEGSDEEICTCHNNSNLTNDFLNQTTNSVNNEDDLPSKDVDLSSYIQAVSISEDMFLQHHNNLSPDFSLIQRKRKLNDICNNNNNSSTNCSINGIRINHDHENNSCNESPSTTGNSRKRLALDYMSTPRSSQQLLSNSTIISTIPIYSSPTTPSYTTINRTPRSIIPTKDNPPPELQNWLTQFKLWSPVERLLAVDRLIEHCEPQQVRHMMKVIEPQFQRDFISLLPRELALQVLSYLDPKDLLRAAQTCRSWRFLCDDNLLWKEKCKTAQILTEPTTDRPKRGRAGNMPPISSPWKAAYMRQHIIEMNWRTRPIRDPKILKGHDDHVITCLQFSGNRIVSGSDDNTLKVWSAVSGKCLRTLIGHTGGVWSSQMAGNVIISGSTDRTLKVWDMETGQCIHTLLGHTSTVRCMHLHGKKVVSGSRDATLRVWDIEQGTCLHVLVGHLAAVRCVQYDGKLIVSGAYDYMVKIWHPERQECLHTLQGHTNRVYSLQFDGIHVVSGSLDTSIRVWDAETGNSKHTLMGHQSLTSGMELRSNILVSGNADSTVKVWDITTGQCLQTLSGPNKHQSAVTCLQFNSRFVITSSDDGTVKLWDVKTGEFIRNLVALDSGGSGGVVWRIRANDTKLICAVGSRNGTEETKLMVLDFDVEGACVKCS